jgi:mRNA-degrading endonuclease RelE of RelBE toxin-antitoxin system
MDKYIKFINRLNSKQRSEIQKIIVLILSQNTGWLDISKVQWKKDHYRVRKWDIRIIFSKTPTRNIIIHVWNRWDIYKSL